MKRRKRKFSINARLKLMMMSIFVPMVCMVVYLLMILISTTNAYNKVTDSVIYSNQYARNFKERMDYSMYLAVVAGKSMNELGEGEQTVNGIVTVNPYGYIDELENACDRMSAIATVDANRVNISRLKKSLENLRKCVREIDENIQKRGMYDTNVELLDKNIYTFTTIIQNTIQDYVYNENNNFTNVQDNLTQENWFVIRICLIASLLVAALSIAVAMIASGSVTRPIQTLCEMTSKVAKGDFTARTDNESADEIAVLTDSFNNMTAKIGRLIEDIKEEEENLHITEIKLLQAQINPHFLYNTLDTIVWLAQADKTQEVVSMVTSLSSYFRTTLSEGRDCVMVCEEEEHIRSYLEIQGFRYQDILTYEINIDSEIYHYVIPKLTLQPIVENALYHGIKNKRGKGHICIEGYRSNYAIIFKVVDNGIGMDEQELACLRRELKEADVNNTKGFGLKNVNKRIQYYYGAEYGVSFESKKGQGTEVTVVLSTKSIETA